MNILVTTASYLPVIGGAQLHVHSVAQRLGRRHAIRVVTQWSTHRTDWLLGTTLRAPVRPWDYQVDGIPVHGLEWTLAEKLRALPSVVTYYCAQRTAIDGIAATLLGKLGSAVDRVDLVHHARIGREPLGFASLALARQRRVPFVLTPYHHPRWGGWWHRGYHRLYRAADGVIALTNTEKRALAGLGVAEERITVAGTGPVVAPSWDGARFRHRYGVAGPLVLFLGQKYRYKHADSLLAAARLVWRQRPDVCFAFIGPRTRHSRALFAGVADRRVVELGCVDLQEKSDALAACDVLCLPSTQESFGGVFVEGWMAEKPVIGARIPAVAEVVDDGVNGLLTEPDAGGIARCILRLVDDRALAATLGRAGRAKALAHYTWDRIAAAVEDAYARAVDRATAGTERC